MGGDAAAGEKAIKSKSSDLSTCMCYRGVLEYLLLPEIDQGPTNGPLRRWYCSTLQLDEATASGWSLEVNSDYLAVQTPTFDLGRWLVVLDWVPAALHRMHS